MSNIHTFCEIYNQIFFVRQNGLRMHDKKVSFTNITDYKVYMLNDDEVEVKKKSSKKLEKNKNNDTIDVIFYGIIILFLLLFLHVFY